MDPIALLEEMLPIDTTGGGERALANHLLPRLEALGYEVREQAVDGGRVNLWATRGEPTIVLCTHLDTVPPHLPHRREGDTLWGRGACDAKGQIAAMIAAAESIRRGGKGNPALLLVSGEESDHAGARAAASLRMPPVPIVLGEPTRCALIRGGKGLLKLVLIARGRAAHSAFPELGDSAIEKLIRALERLLRAPLPSDPDFGSTTLNIGRIAGGVADNVVAPNARAEVFVRAALSTRRIEGIIRGCVADEEIEIEATNRSEPIKFDTIDGFDTGVVPFGTDGPFLPRGHPLYLIGPGDIRLAHSVDERIDAGELYEGIERLECLMLRKHP